MSKHFDKLLKTLKTRQDVTALGFSKDELKSLASDIDENLESIEETATDEDVENKIKEAIDGVIPMLKLAQMQASRIVAKKLKESDEARQAAEEEAKKKKEEEEEERRKADEEAKKKANEEGKKDDSNPAPKNEDDELKTLIKALNEKMTKQEEALAKQNETIANLMKGNVKEKRKAIVDAKLKDAGTIGRTYKRMFEKINFEDDAQFNEFLEQIDEDLNDYKQDVANEILAKNNPTPPAVPPKKEDDGDKVEVMSDEEIDGLVEEE